MVRGAAGRKARERPAHVGRQLARAAPARAASMVAFSASRLVCPAMLEISPTTSPIRDTDALSSRTSVPVRSPSLTATRASSAEPSTCRPISSTDAPSSSAAAATVTDWPAVSEAVAVRVRAVACSSVAEDDTIPTIPPTAASKSSVSYSARISAQSVSATLSASSCTAAIAACSWYGPSARLVARVCSTRAVPSAISRIRSRAR